jgi:MSHA biogenesis protein MshJ
MKQRLQPWLMRIDLLSLRERAMLFASVVAVAVWGANALFIAPLEKRQAELAGAIRAKQQSITALSNEIDQKVRDHAGDPDETNRKKLVEVRADIARMGADLQTMQRGMVAPERVGPLLGSLLRSHGSLRLVSMRTLPVTGLSEAMPLPDDKPAPKPGEPAAPAVDLTPASILAKATADTAALNQPKPPEPPPVQKAPELVYRHGVELTVRGSYLDMLSYLAALEAMPTQLFWGQVSMDATDHQDARMTLTVFTLSLDQKWMKL